MVAHSELKTSNVERSGTCGAAPHSPLVPVCNAGVFCSGCQVQPIAPTGSVCTVGSSAWGYRKASLLLEGVRSRQTLERYLGGSRAPAVLQPMGAWRGLFSVTAWGAASSQSATSCDGWFGLAAFTHLLWAGVCAISIPPRSCSYAAVRRCTPSPRGPNWDAQRELWAPRESQPDTVSAL